MALHPAARWGAVGFLGFLVLHFLLSFSSPTYHESVDAVVSHAKSKLGSVAGQSEVWYDGKKQKPGYKSITASQEFDDEFSSTASTNSSLEIKANATFVSLARNSDLWELLESIRGIEDRFNHRKHYSWVFLNEQPFSNEFKERTSALVSGQTYYGMIEAGEAWPKGSTMPPNIDDEKARGLMAEMGRKPIPYAGSLPYRKMCRYQSGYFWRHPLLEQFDYYWRVEPSVKFYCDIQGDPFMTMKKGNKKYGWVVSLYEYRDTIVTLWDTTKKFMKEFPEHIPENNLMKFLSDDGGENYNLCHFWSNFEIADLSLWRSPAYRAYFDYLDQSGGFFYERWGDAPVHSIAAALFLKPEEFHFFNDIGYFHNPFLHCPAEGEGKNCVCNPKHENAFEFHGYSCTPRYKKILGDVFST